MRCGSNQRKDPGTPAPSWHRSSTREHCVNALLGVVDPLLPIGIQLLPRQRLLNLIHGRAGFVNPDHIPDPHVSRAAFRWYQLSHR